MSNPFLRRATEYVRDDEAFLALVSPEPVKYFLAEEGGSGRLYDRLTVIRGTPGSGKTTIARLFDTSCLSALLRNRDVDNFRPLVTALTDVLAIRDGLPAIAGCRLPLETDYRDFWEFPYPAELRSSLMHGLIQARAMLAWIRGLAATGIGEDRIQIVARQDAYSAVESIGGPHGPGLVRRAREVEAALYGIISSLVAPPVASLKTEATSSYRPFDVIDRFRVAGDPFPAGGADLIPLVVLDDAHTLHPDQFASLKRWLVRRELRVSRWMLTRLDVLHPAEALAAIAEEPTAESELPGIGLRREVTNILLQGGSGRDRRQSRVNFRRTARDMGDRYLRQMPQFSAKQLFSLTSLLQTEVEPLPPSKLKDLEAAVHRTARKLSISDKRLAAIQGKVSAYEQGAQPLTEDVRLAVTSIMLHRFSKRAERHRGLFETDEESPQLRPMDVNSGVVDGARLQLFHQEQRPYFVGFDDLCDASSDNAEQFLRLAAVLVEASAVQLTRGRSGTLSPRTQHMELRDAATKMMDDWNFPHAVQVRRLVDRIARSCVEISLHPNAPLAAGANAMGFPQEEFDQLPERFPDFARWLQFAVAYNALTLVPNYDCKKKAWCLLELGGIPLLHYGLTLKRGGFIESSLADLVSLLRDPQA